MNPMGVGGMVGCGGKLQKMGIWGGRGLALFQSNQAMRPCPPVHLALCLLCCEISYFLLLDACACAWSMVVVMVMAIVKVKGKGKVGIEMRVLVLLSFVIQSSLIHVLTLWPPCAFSFCYFLLLCLSSNLQGKETTPFPVFNRCLTPRGDS